MIFSLFSNYKFWQEIFVLISHEKHYFLRKKNTGRSFGVKSMMHFIFLFLRSSKFIYNFGPMKEPHCQLCGQKKGQYNKPSTDMILSTTTKIFQNMPALLIPHPSSQSSRSSSDSVSSESDSASESSDGSRRHHKKGAASPLDLSF